MDKLLVLSDLHLSAGERIAGLDPSERLDRGLARITRDHPDAKALILLGDLTHRGTIAQYQELHKRLQDLPFPVFPMLGNHDQRDHFLQVFGADAACETGYVQHVVDLPTHRIVMLDTLDGPPFVKGHHSGALSPEQLEWLEDTLAGRGNRDAIVFMHHPPFVTGIAGMDKIRLDDGEAILRLLAKHGVAHLFCGHLHRSVSGTTQRVPWTLIKSTNHQGPLDLISLDSSLSTDDPAGYALVLLGQGTVVCHHEDIDAAAVVSNDPASG